MGFNPLFGARGCMNAQGLGPLASLSGLQEDASMNDVISAACLVVPGLLPLVVLGLRAARPRMMPWWAAFLLVVGLGWGLLWVGAMVNETAHGGSGHVGALFLGWAIMLAWFSPWLLGYALIQFVRRRRALAHAVGAQT